MLAQSSITTQSVAVASYDSNNITTHVLVSMFFQVCFQLFNIKNLRLSDNQWRAISAILLRL